MSENFDFVERGLENVKKGDANREEIHAVIEEFKVAIYDACKKQHNREVTFVDVRSLSALSAMMSLRGGVPAKDSAKNVGDVTVYLGIYPGPQIFRYELDPISGYPVILGYAMKSVQCDNKDTLLATIRDAYNYSVGALKEFCETGYMSSLNPLRLWPRSDRFQLAGLK